MELCLPGTPAAAPRRLLFARLQLSTLRCFRERPVSLFAGILVFLAVVLLRSRACQPCDAALPHQGSGAGGGTDSHTGFPRAAISSSAWTAADFPTVVAKRIGAERADDIITMAHIVVGVMTCGRFHQTRCRAQSSTWLRRARRVVFYSDVADQQTSNELHAPVIAHRFEPSATERVFSGGNWRAVPILRSLAEEFFSSRAEADLRARHEPVPKWVFMVDDDSFAFTPQVLATLRARDPDQPHYLGYAFIAAPHLEGIVPGKRQPLFANGGAGIAVSRGALKAALPIFERCEATYKWNWPGDVRVAQCLLDAGVSVEWIKSFHAEAPGVIIHKQRPPPGSVPVGLHLPPISFHHVDADALFSLERMQTVQLSPAAVAAATATHEPHEVDWSKHAFQPLHATHPRTGVQLQMHFGYEVLVHPPAFGAGRGADAIGGVGGGDEEMQDEVKRSMLVGNHLASFVAVAASASFASSAPLRYVQTFTGGECRQSGRLLGGLSAVVTTHCGTCDDAGEGSEGGRGSHSEWQPSLGATGLAVCSFSFVSCTARVRVALSPSECPKPSPRLRVGLDIGTAPGTADAARDGVPTFGWFRSYGSPASKVSNAAGGCDADGAECTTVRASVTSPSPTNLTLWARVLSGETVVHVPTRPTVTAGAWSGGNTLSLPKVELADARESTLLLSGATATLEPPATSMTFAHVCTRTGSFDVRATLLVREHVSVPLSWRIDCS